MLVKNGHLTNRLHLPHLQNSSCRQPLNVLSPHVNCVVPSDIYLSQGRSLLNDNSGTDDNIQQSRWSHEGKNGEYYMLL